MEEGFTFKAVKIRDQSFYKTSSAAAFPIFSFSICFLSIQSFTITYEFGVLLQLVVCTPSLSLSLWYIKQMLPDPSSSVIYRYPDHLLDAKNNPKFRRSPVQ